MSENLVTPQDNTEGADDLDTTLITDEVKDEQPSGPKPLYQDEEKKEEPKEEPEDSKEEPEVEKDDKSTDKGEEYESLDKPEDSLLSDADMERIVEKAKQQGLSKEVAQKQVEMVNDLLKSHSEDLTRRHGEISSEWVEQCKADKEIGGEKFNENVSFARKALTKFGTEELFKSLDETKFGNNPEVIRVFARIGRAMSSDSVVRSGVHPGGQKSLEQVFYPNNKEN